MAESTNMIVLKCMDDQQFTISANIMRISSLINTFHDPEDTVIDTVQVPIPNVMGEVMVHIIYFCTQYNVEPILTIPKPLPKGIKRLDALIASDKCRIIPDWAVRFGDMPEGFQVFNDIMHAAYYLDIQPLIDFGAAVIAMYLRTHNLDEIRTTLHMVDDLTPERKQEIITRNTWL